MVIRDGIFLVTGGAGLIGSHIVDQLVGGEAKRVIAVDNMLRGRPENLAHLHADPRFELVDGDIRDRSLMRDLMAEVDGVFHMAALRIKHCIEDPELATELMFSAPIRLFLDAADLSVGRIVTASSSSVYGQAETFPTDEQHHPYGDLTFYGAGKLAIEGVLRSIKETHGLSYAAMRFFNVYGPRMDTHGAYTEVMVRWMNRIDAGQRPLIFGDGSDAMDFTYVGDAADACLRAMEADSHIGAYNVGTGVSTTLRNMCETLLRVMGSDLQPEFCEVDASNAVRRRQAATRKARDELGFEAQTSLEAGLRELVDWWRAGTANMAAQSIAQAT